MSERRTGAWLSTLLQRDTVHCLTMTDPRGTLVALGAKRIETRSWLTPYRGPLAIHIAKTLPPEAAACCDTSPFSQALEAGGYRWQPEEDITAVDPFSTGMSAPFLSVSLHQPLSNANASPDRLELEFMMQNILAQGYRPVYLLAGRTLYFAQAPRLVTGGLAFSF